MSRLGGVALTRYMDGRTDRVIPIYPPKLCLRGYKEDLKFQLCENKSLIFAIERINFFSNNCHNLHGGFGCWTQFGKGITQ